MPRLGIWRPRSATCGAMCRVCRRWFPFALMGKHAGECRPDNHKPGKGNA